MLCQKKCWVQKKMLCPKKCVVPKSLFLKKFGSKKLWVKKNLGKKAWFKKLVCKICSKKIFGSKQFMGPKHFESKNEGKKDSGSNILWAWKNDRSKKSL